jgi:hypothetical protein
MGTPELARHNIEREREWHGLSKSERMTRQMYSARRGRSALTTMEERREKNRAYQRARYARKKAEKLADRSEPC